MDQALHAGAGEGLTPLQPGFHQGALVGQEVTSAIARLNSEKQRCMSGIGGIRHDDQLIKISRPLCWQQNLCQAGHYEVHGTFRTDEHNSVCLP